MKAPAILLAFALFAFALLTSTSSVLLAGDAPAAKLPKVLLIAGPPSHGPGDHEHLAGMKLLAKCLEQMGGVEPVVVDLKKGWPSDELLGEAKTIAIFSDGRGGHPLLQDRKDGKHPRMETFQKLVDKGVGLVFIHYAVDFPKGAVGDRILDWMGGYYEDPYSTNPHNRDVLVTPPSKDHPISRGLAPFKASDEFYYRIRFRPDDTRVTPILTFEPKDRAGQGTQTIAWATQRADGGRSFGFTGGHFHTNWGIEEFRRMALNAILWTAHVDVPPNGAQSTVTPEDLKQNLDPK